MFDTPDRFVETSNRHCKGNPVVDAGETPVPRIKQKEPTGRTATSVCWDPNSSLRPSLPSLDARTEAALRAGIIAYPDLVLGHIQSAMANVLLTERQLAERWSVSVKLLQKLRYEGEGPIFTKIGSSVRYSLADILAYEDARKLASTSQDLADGR